MAIDIDRYAHIESTLKRWDVRYKIASLGVFILAVSLVKTLPIAVAALCAALVALNAAKLPREFVRNGIQFVAIFLVPFLLILPFSYPGESPHRLLGMEFAFEGLRLGILIVIKAIAIVLTSYAIFGTSRFDVSMIALQRLKCPKIFVQMLLFTYRYIFVFLAELRRMEVAMKARGFVPKANLATLTTFGNFIGTLLVRSFERTERIYKAMLSKGYHGEFYTMVEFNSQSRDYSKMVIAITAAIALLVVDNFGGFSRAELGWI